MTSEPQFLDKFVAFVDILGFQIQGRSLRPIRRCATLGNFENVRGIGESITHSIYCRIWTHHLPGEQIH